jgi:hypothetical protein
MNDCLRLVDDTNVSSLIPIPFAKWQIVNNQENQMPDGEP